MRVIGLLLLVMCLATPVRALAQTVPAAELFPPADAFGAEWSGTAPEDIDASQWPALSRMMAARYFGPNGSRVLIGILQVDDGPAAARDAWTFAGTIFDLYRLSFNPDPDVAQALADAPLIDGCATMRRAQGMDKVFTETIAVGVSLCAADPDTIVLVYVSGAIDTDTGYQASDRALALVLTTPHP